MNNINIYKSFFLAMLALLSAGCEKDFLERAPGDFVSTEEVFSDIESAEDFLNNAYNALPDFFMPGADANWMLSSATDETEQIWDIGGDGNDFNTGNWNPQSFPLQGFWFGYYNAIRRINVFIQNYELIPNDNINVGRKERMLGEAYGLRAYYHFELMRMWGRIPVIDRVLDPSDPVGTMLSRNELNEVVDFIKADIDRAVNLLPARHPQANFGRFTSLTGLALWSRVTLYYASPLHNPNNDVLRWQAAAVAAQAAIAAAQASNYTLSIGAANEQQAYERIFLEQMNSEVIFTRTGTENWWDQVTQSNGNGGWAGTSPIQEMVDSYEMRNGLLPVEAGSGYNDQNPYVNRDARFYQSILYHGAQWKGRAMDFTNPGGADFKTDHPPTNYFLKKFMYEPLNLFNGANSLYRPLVLMRLSELYLNYAEAINEASGPNATAYDYMNALRSRAELPPLPTALSQAAFRERVRRERRVELAFEGHRFWDVRRWLIGTTVNNGPIHQVNINAQGVYTYPVHENRVFTERHYLFPIPQIEIDKNPDMIQNPGW